MFKIGQKVRVNIPPKQRQFAAGAVSYNGTIHAITSRKWYAKYAEVTYELEDCQSAAGINYTFCEDWLEPVE